MLRIVLKSGGAAELAAMLKLYGTYDSNAEKKEVLNSIGHIGGTGNKRQVLDWTTSGTVKLQVASSAP